MGGDVSSAGALLPWPSSSAMALTACYKTAEQEFWLFLMLRSPWR
jgi:hypothetical protein